MTLENQIKYVGMALIELEENLARDTIILDKPGAIQEHINMLEVRGSCIECFTIKKPLYVLWALYLYQSYCGKVWIVCPA